MRVGEVLAGRFELLEEVRKGGMGKVFRARDGTSGGIVALKVPTTTTDEDTARFVREAKVLSELQTTSGIVRYVAHEHSESTTYLAMEWLDGRDLRAHIIERGALGIEETIELARHLSTTLESIHARGLIHRDFKPSNVFLIGDRPRAPVLIDFGVVLDRSSAGRDTRAGFLVGTPAYMAPEQVRGDDIDARADLFGLGCVIYTCLSGKPPFSGESVVAVLAKIILEQPAPVAETRDDIPDELADLVESMLSKTPDGRPVDARAVLEVLSRLEKDPSRRTSTHHPIANAALGLSEQRFVTLLLCRLDRERGHEVLEKARALAEKFSAHVERLIDGSLVAWIDAGAATDQASQAGHFALTLRDLVAPSPIGIATARGVVSQRLPIGPVIDRAVALVESAGERRVVLDEVTAGLLDDRFEMKLGDGPPVLVATNETTQGERTLLGRPTPCVGRDRELTTLTALFEECASEPAARAALVVGEAGIGKTRIRHELVRRIREARADATIWMARGDPLGAGSPFGLVRRALRTAMGIRDGDVVAAQSMRLASFVTRAVAAEETSFVGEFVGEIVGVPIAATPSAQLLAARANAVLMGDQLRRAFESLVLAESQTHPLVLVLEDLHWGDLPTVRLVEAALRSARDRPFFVVALARPEINQRFPRLWEGLTVVHVAGLGKKAATRLVREVLEDADDELVERIVERASGHAFTLEELVRAAAAPRKAAKLVLPETVLAMMQRRVDEIAPDQRRILRAASVFGAAFWARGVTELVGGLPGVSEALDSLAERELVQRRSESRFRGESEWTFRHALLREAVYGTLTDEDRTLGHRLAGKWLVRAGESDAVTIAEHFERGQDRTNAAEWYLRAAERALAGNDWREAIACAERGLPLASDADANVRGELHLALAQACGWSGDVRRCEREAIEAAERLEPGSGSWFDAVGEAINAAGMGLGHHDVARKWVDALITTDDAHEDPQATTIALARAITPMLLAGDRARASAIHDLLEHADTEGSPLVEAYGFRARASWAFRGEKDIGAYVELTRAGLAAFVSAGDERTAAQQRTNLGYGLILLGAPESEDVLTEGILESERAGLPIQAATHRQNLGLVLAWRGRFTEALSVERASIDAFREAGDRRFEAASHVYLSTILEASGDFESAEAEAHVALDMSESYPSRRATAYGALAAALLGQGDYGAARSFAEKGLAIVAELGALEEGEEKLRMTYSAALDALGETDKAREVLLDAQQRLRDRAARIRDPRWRESFLENVPENAQLLAMGQSP
jgi:tetratricopeptide (TPR) repeat protein/predicted Ser/Thr protein kinase